MGSGYFKKQVRQLEEENSRLRRELETPIEDRLREAHDEIARLRAEIDEYRDVLDADDPDDARAALRNMDHLHADVAAIREALNIPRPECYPAAGDREGRAERAQEEQR